MNKLSKHDEDNLMSAIEKTIDMTNTGVDPSEAIAKVATAENFMPEMVNRMVERFNISKTLNHLGNAKEASERKADFPIADPVKVADIMFPAKEAMQKELRPLPTKITGGLLDGQDFMKEAVKYKSPFTDTKKYIPYEKDPLWAEKRRFNKMADTERAAKDARIDYGSKCYKLIELAEKTAEYFRTTFFKESFAEVERRIVSVHGEPGKKFMDAVFARNVGNTKRGSYEVGPAVFDTTAEPYRSIEAAMVLGDEIVKAADLCVDLEKLAAVAKKAAVGAAIMPAALRTISHSVMSDPGKGYSKYEDDIDRVLDEEFVEDISRQKQKVKATTLLRELMTTDPVIQDYSPDVVVKAFNELSENLPATVTSSLALRGNLRKLLQQEALEPFELKQISDVETALRKPVSPIGG